MYQGQYGEERRGEERRGGERRERMMKARRERSRYCVMQNLCFAKCH